MNDDLLSRGALKNPLFKSVPTYRNYEDYHDAEQYVRGWNDAMRFIFGIYENRDNHCQHIWEEIIDKEVRKGGEKE